MEARLRTPWRVRGAPKKPLDGTGAWMGHTNGVHLWQLFQFHPLYLQVPCNWVYDLPQKNRSSSSFMGMLQVSSPLHLSPSLWGRSCWWGGVPAHQNPRQGLILRGAQHRADGAGRHRRQAVVTSAAGPTEVTDPCLHIQWNCQKLELNPKLEGFFASRSRKPTHSCCLL